MESGQEPQSRETPECSGTEDSAEAAQVRLRFVLEQLPAAVWTTDLNLRLLSVTGKALSDLGRTPEMMVGRPIAEGFASHGGASGEMALAHQSALAGEAVSMSLALAGRVTLSVHVEPLRDARGEICGAIGVALNISDARDAERRLEHQAYHDPLTDLPNRAELQRVLQRRISEMDGPAEELAIIFVDLDGFAYLNDTFGHTRGDDILVDVAERLRSRLGQGDFLCRWGGDEFVILHRSAQGSDEIAKTVEYILEALSSGVVIDGRRYNIAATAGISIAPRDGTNWESLLRAADTAMYQAK
ncbi:MAG: GGDEF domain-containing protein, partial [bacterium]|nr:GGDEF domain-containing protein [bacterium]